MCFFFLKTMRVFVDPNSPCKDLVFPHGPNLAQKPLSFFFFIGNVLKEQRNKLYSVDSNVLPPQHDPILIVGYDFIRQPIFDFTIFLKSKTNPEIKNQSKMLVKCRKTQSLQFDVESWKNIELCKKKMEFGRFKYLFAAAMATHGHTKIKDVRTGCYRKFQHLRVN